jgi:hypothetical protein
MTEKKPVYVQLNGAEMLGHHIVIERQHLGGIQMSPVDVNEEALHSMVKRLLAQVTCMHAAQNAYSL